MHSTIYKLATVDMNSIFKEIENEKEIQHQRDIIRQKAMTLSILQKLLPDACKMQAVSQFAILVPPERQTFVVAVHLHDVVFPKRHVATAQLINALAVTASEIFLQRLDTHRVEHVARLHIANARRNALAVKHFLRSFGRQIYTAAAHETTPLGQIQMVLHKVATENDIAVGLDDVLTFASGKSLVHDFAFAKTAILLPYVHNRHWRLCRVTLNKFGRLGGRAIVGNDYLVGHNSLIHCAFEAQIQILRFVVCRYHKRGRYSFH